MMLTASGAGDVPAPKPNVWAQIKRTPDLELKRDPTLPADIRKLFRAFAEKKHDDRAIQKLAVPWIQQAIVNLRDDEVKWNAHGASRFLGAARHLAVPQLELAMVVGDEQQRMMVSELLLRAKSVSDPKSLAASWVWLMRDGGDGLSGPNGVTAFRVLASSSQMLRAATPELIEQLGSRDRQLQINAAILLCLVEEGDDHAERIVEVLAPLLDDDDHMGTASTALSSLSFLGLPAIDPLRDQLHLRDEQGTRLTRHLLHVIAGPHTPDARQMPLWERRAITTLRDDPAQSSAFIRFINVYENEDLYASHLGAMTSWWCSHARHQRSKASQSAAESIAVYTLIGATERAAKRQLEYRIAAMPPEARRKQEAEIRRWFDELLEEYGPAQPDPPAFRDFEDCCGPTLDARPLRRSSGT
ncbi:MAG: adaptin domain-containing protein [Phycisphaerales bacterium]|nr:adaptin domain-containing protein [Phycisphaerales bacterium]